MHEWPVITFRPDGSVEQTVQTSEALGLAPRDVSLFAPRPAGLSSQRATIAPREDAVLVRTEIAAAIVKHDTAYIFPCRRDRDTARLAQSVLDHVAETSPLPFELRVMEALLDETARQFERRHRRLELLSVSIEEDISKNLRNSGSDLQRLLPIQRALTEIQHDVKEAREAIQEVVDDDKVLAAVCLSDEDDMSTAAMLASGRQTPRMRMAAALLGSYERQIQSVEGSLREMAENLEVFREVWSMHLSATRNRIIRINLVVTVASFALSICIVPASFFGMNLPHGLEDDPAVFWPIVAASVAVSGAMFGAVYAYWRFWPNRRHEKRVLDLKALRDLLLYHVDDLEDIMAALKHRHDTDLESSSETGIDKEEFSTLVRQVIKDREVRRDELDLLYRVFDTNRNGFLELGEVVKHQQHMDKSSALDQATARAATGLF
ncbi:g11208 [Coccomyxa elongata]